MFYSYGQDAFNIKVYWSRAVGGIKIWEMTMQPFRTLHPRKQWERKVILNHGFLLQLKSSHAGDATKNNGTAFWSSATPHSAFLSWKSGGVSLCKTLPEG